MKLRAFLQRLIISSDLKSLAERHRIEVSIPEDGFESMGEFNTWSAHYSEDEIVKNFNVFLSEALKIARYKKTLSPQKFKEILFEYYYFLHSFDPDDFAEDYGSDLFSIIRVTKTKKTKISDGIYLRIPVDATISEIRELVLESAEEIKKSQLSFSDEQGLKQFDIGNWRQYDRDRLIARLYEFPAAVLAGHFGVKIMPKQYKEHVVADILNLDPNYRGIKADTVKKSITRYNQRKKWLRET